jgi:hypothetical protein
MVDEDELVFWSGNVYVNPSKSLDGKIRGYSASPGITVELMQYTGLKDKNGVGIYEGDIIRHKNQYIDIVAPVKWMENSAAWSLNSKYLDEIEVIGNIYEHPHLIENTQQGSQEAA